MTLLRVQFRRRGFALSIRAARLLFAIVFAAVFVCAQDPYVNYRGAVNAASFMTPGISGGEIAQGSMFSIFGSYIGPATLSQASSFPLGTALAGVSVKVTQGSTSVDAFPVVVTAGQINVIMPSNAPLGRVSIRVTYGGVTSNPVTATVAKSAFGIFAVNSGGFGPGIVQNFIAQDNQPINSLTATATPGQVVTLWGTGLGPVASDNTAPVPGNVATPVEIFVGGKLATSLYNGRAPCCSSIDQIVFKIPDDAPLGCYVPVQIRTSGTTLSNAVTIAIQKDGSSCTDANNPISDAFRKGGKAGVAVLSRSEIYDDINSVKTSDVTEDLAGLSFRASPGGPFFFNPSISGPPIGTCTMYTHSGHPDLLNFPDLFGGIGVELSAGPAVNISGASSAALAAATSSPLYAAQIGSNDPAFGASSLVIASTGSTTVSTQGGGVVGAFQVNIPVPQALNWTDQTQFETIDRTQPLTVHWNPAGLANALMIVSASAYDLPNNTQRSFACSADAASGAFTVPSYILSALPATRAGFGQSRSALSLGLFPAQSAVPFSASGIDAAFALEILTRTKVVMLQ